ncbi:uncharacterized protein LOC105431900, partial [Pogonomyrmex barbatus]|uniref:Uncharacterized protein LOC105431900 n=1 Tax=Pogonomyrmex barbatus TaxID=144034 RepID=A0A6I9WXI0_9HYME
MSEVERADPTAGGDAPTVGFIEAMKPDRDDNAIAVSEVKSTVATSEDATASAEEIAKETLNAQVEGERSAEATNDETSISSEEKSVNSDAKTTDIIEEIAHTTTENVDVVQTETERLSTEEGDSSPAIVPQSEESSQSKSNTEDKADKSKQNARGNNATCISRLEAEVRKRTKERDSYRKQLEDAETKLAALQASYDAMASPGGDGDLQRSMEQLRGQLVQTALMYEERNRIVANQENQINALNNQVTSLKEVVSITRDLLQIRNMEVKQLQVSER